MLLLFSSSSKSIFLFLGLNSGIGIEEQTFFIFSGDNCSWEIGTPNE